MHLTQGTFSYLPPLSDEQIRAQIQYALDKGWAVSIEFTDDPHPRNVYWEMWGLPMFDARDAAGIMQEVRACREQHAGLYIKVNAYDSSLGRQTTALSFIVNRPQREPGFRLVRTQAAGRRTEYTLEAYAAAQPSGERYS